MDGYSPWQQQEEHTKRSISGFVEFRMGSEDMVFIHKIVQRRDRFPDEVMNNQDIEVNQGLGESLQNYYKENAKLRLQHINAKKNVKHTPNSNHDAVKYGRIIKTKEST